MKIIILKLILLHLIKRKKKNCNKMNKVDENRNKIIKITLKIYGTIFKEIEKEVRVEV